MARTAPPLSTAQVAQFKRDGFLVLPDCVDPALCEALLDASWDELTSVWAPNLRRGDVSTYVPAALEAPSKRDPERNNSHPGGDPRFDCGGHRFYLKNGADERSLDLFPRALWPVVDQLCGKDRCVWPKGVGADGKISGPVFMDAGTESGLSTHCETTPRWPAPLVTEEFAEQATSTARPGGACTARCPTRT